MSIIIWNIAGLLPKLGDADFIEYLHNFDVIIFSETHTLHEFDHKIKFPDYDCRQINATKLQGQGHPSGGVAILIRQTLNKFVSFDKK